VYSGAAKWVCGKILVGSAGYRAEAAAATGREVGCGGVVRVRTDAVTRAGSRMAGECGVR